MADNDQAARGSAGAALPALLLGLFALFQALATNNFPDLFIYRAGSEMGLRGESPYSIERIRALATAQFPDPNDPPKEDAFVLNCGYFLPPLAILVFTPFALVPWGAAKVVWAVALGIAALGIATLPNRFRTPEGESVRRSPLRLAVPFLLVLNPLTLAIVVVGQTTIAAVGCVSAGLWCFERRRPALGVLLWALPFVKPHVALPLIPLAWYLGGWKRAAALVALVAALNVIGATVAGGSPLFLRDYLDYLPTGHKAVLFNQAERNAQITSWNRLLALCGGPLIELNATTTLAGYLVWGGLVLGRCAAGGVKPSAAWACAATAAGAVVCSQVLASELLLLAVAVPWVRDLFATNRRACGCAAVALLALQAVPIDRASVLFNYYRSAGAMAFALLVLIGPTGNRAAEVSPTRL